MIAYGFIVQPVLMKVKIVETCLAYLQNSLSSPEFMIVSYWEDIRIYFSKQFAIETVSPIFFAAAVAELIELHYL